MSLSLVPLLLVGTAVPQEARHALWMSQRAAGERERTLARQTAAQVLRATWPLSCSEVCELLDLAPGPGACGPL